MTAAARLPRGAGPAPVAAVAGRLLDYVVAWYAEREDPDDPDAPTPLPARRYLAGGAPREVPWDCQDGQVTVTLERVITALHPDSPAIPARSPRANPANLGRVNRSASLEVQIVRCAPAPPDDPLGLPSVEELHAHALLLDADGGHLLSAVVDAVRSGALLREHVGQGQTGIGDVFSLGPMGGAAAVALLVTVPLL
jgi:hypothetical protein